MAAGLYAYHARPSPASDLRELFPWDLSIGLDVLCGLALCAGGFTVAATIRILNLLPQAGEHKIPLNQYVIKVGVDVKSVD